MYYKRDWKKSAQKGYYHRIYRERYSRYGGCIFSVVGTVGKIRKNSSKWRWELHCFNGKKNRILSGAEKSFKGAKIACNKAEAGQCHHEIGV